MRCRLTLAQRRARRWNQRGLGMSRYDQHLVAFRCPVCREWVCAKCEGTHSGDRVLDRLCDVCWGVEVARRTARRTMLSGVR